MCMCIQVCIYIYIDVKTSLQAKFGFPYTSQTRLVSYMCTLMSMYNVNTHKHLCSALFTPISQKQELEGAVL